MSSKLFEYAIILHGVEGKNAEKPKLIADVSRVIASSEEQAIMLAAREIPEEYLDVLDRVQVVIRPF